jgi:hypothetical protein
MSQGVDLQGLGVLVGIGVPWSGALLWMVRWLLDRYFAALEARFTALEEELKSRADDWQRTERALLELKAELPVQYLRKEDAIRGEVVIHAKLDALAAKIEQLRGSQ